MYGWNMLYQQLGEYSKYQADEKSTGFILEEVWQETLDLEKDLGMTQAVKTVFFKRLEWLYEISIEKERQDSIKTIGDVKQMITSRLDDVM